MEACATGKPAQVFEWARKKKRGRFLDLARWPKLHERMIEQGFVKPPRDFDAYHRVLRARGLTTRLGDEPRAPARVPDDRGATVEWSRALFPEEAEQ